MGGAISAAGTLMGANRAANAADRATQAQTDAANRQIDLDREIFQTRYNDPYLVSTKNLAISAQNALAPLAGLAPPQTSGGPAQPAGGNALTMPAAQQGPNWDAYARLPENGDVVAAFGRLSAADKQNIARSGYDPNSLGGFMQFMVENDQNWQRAIQSGQRPNPSVTIQQPAAPTSPPPAAAPTTPAPGNALADGASTIENALKANPAYEFVRKEGEKGVNAQLGLRGLTDSGARAKAISAYNQDYAGTRLDEERAFLRSLATGGQYATGVQSNALAAFGNNAGSAIRYGGNALAEGAYSAAAPWAGAAGQIGTQIGGAIDDWLAKRKKNALAGGYG